LPVRASASVSVGADLADLPLDLHDLRGTLKPHLHNSESLSDPKNEAFSPT
jgi:hypothetical protein